MLENQKTLILGIQKCRKKIKEKFNSYFSLNGIPLTFDQWLIIQEIHSNKGINQKTIASNLSKEVAAVSRIINKLESNDLIVRKSNDKNLREFNTYLSLEGSNIVEKIIPFEKKVFKELFNGIYEQEINLVNNVLKRIDEN